MSLWAANGTAVDRAADEMSVRVMRRGWRAGSGEKELALQIESTASPFAPAVRDRTEKLDRERSRIRSAISGIDRAHLGGGTVANPP
jgi:hypothetical protein